MSTPTTLVTFLLRAPEGTFAVELLGSWDNFSKPYKLSRDCKTGDHNWRGCHFFEGITCDGDTSDLSEMRNGGLMMGGTYWYYYRLNSEIEYHDPIEPYTSSCPLLPGQPVNVMEVPVQPSRTYSGNDSSDSLDSLVFTLDPRDKYLPPGVRRARTTSAIQQRRTFLPRTPKVPLTTTTCDALEAGNPPPTASSTRDGPTLRPQRSLVSVFDKLRRTKSAGSSSPRATSSWHRKIFSRAGTRAGSKAEYLQHATPPEDIPAVPQLPAHILAASNSNCSAITPPPPPPLPPPFLKGSPAAATTDPAMSLSATMEGLSVSPRANDRDYTVLLEDSTKEREQIFGEAPNTSLQGKFGAPSRPRPVLFHPPEMEETRSKHGDPSSSVLKADKLPTESFDSSAFLAITAAPQVSPPEGRTVFVDVPSQLPQDGEEESTDRCKPILGLSYAESYGTGDSFSPNLASNSTQSGPMSPMQLSQPETPNMSDFDEDDAASWIGGSDSLDFDVVKMKPPSRAPPPPPPSQAPVFSNPFRIHPPLSGFQGYSLPQDEQGSMHTIRKPASTTSVRNDHPLQQQTSSKDLVHSWNDGSEHRITALEELVDDLGYLGAFIV